jgi:NAD(P)-dependent dehydrogenase (short-subunit alcohol dehydrogenase family)
MAHVFISGSSTGLGLMAGRLLAGKGHQVVLHARSAGRADDARREVPSAESIVVGDLSTIEGARGVADQVNEFGAFDAVIHNAAVGYREGHKLTPNGLPHVFAVNTLAPYILTALIARPKRLVYMSSGMHRGADVHLDDLLWEKRSWRGSEAYAESKLHDAMLAFAVGRLWGLPSNAVDPGWVATRMGGAGAPDDLDQGYATQAWLAISDEPAALASGRYFYHKQAREPNRQALDAGLQDRLLEACARISGIGLPA